MATYNDSPPVIGPLAHTPPLFFKLKILNIFDIYKLQLGKLVHQSVNVIGPACKVINLASELHCHNTRYAKHGNFYVIVSSVRTTRLLGLLERVPNYGKIYQTTSKTSKTTNILMSALRNI